MARYNANRYQYETSPRKLQPEYIPVKKKYPKKSTASKKTIDAQKQAKVAQSKNIKIMIYLGIIFAILFAVSYRNALVAQRYNELKNLKVQLAKIEKVNLLQVLKSRGIRSEKDVVYCDVRQDGTAFISQKNVSDFSVKVDIKGGESW